MLLEPYREFAELTKYVEHDGWSLQRPVALRRYEGGGGVVMDLNLRRLPHFYERVIIFPSKVLYILSSVVFLMPVESGEKMSVAVTILLAQVVTFQTLTDILPASSLNFPRLAYFVFLITIHLAAVCCLGVISKYNIDSKNCKTFIKIIV